MELINHKTNLKDGELKNQKNKPQEKVELSWGKHWKPKSLHWQQKDQSVTPESQRDQNQQKETKEV